MIYNSTHLFLQIVKHKTFLKRHILNIAVTDVLFFLNKYENKISKLDCYQYFRIKTYIDLKG